MIEDNQKANMNLLLAIYKRKALFIIVGIISVIIGVAVTFLTPKKYRSSGTVYAVSSNSYDNIIANPTFGNDDAADQLIQLFESSYMKDRIIKEFDLVNYYKIDTSNPTWQSLVYESYDGDITFNRTRYSSIMVQAITKDPELSAKIVNRLMEAIDEEREKIYKTNINLIVANYEKEYRNKKQIVDKLLDSIYALSGNSSSAKNNPLFKNRNMFMEERQKNTHIYPGDAAVKKITSTNQTQIVETLINDYYFMQGRLNFIKGKLDDAQLKKNQPIAGIYKVSKAKPNYKKVSPKLSINVIAFGFIGFILTLLFVLIQERLKIVQKALV